MNRRFSLLILVILGVAGIVMCYHILPVNAVIWIGGHITSDTTWAPVDTYRVINDTYIDPNVTLTILPNVHVEFADGFSLIVEGSLNATGTDTSPIVFTSSRVLPNDGVWNTIDFKGASNCSFVLEHSRVEYAVNGITVESQGSTIITRSEFYNCSENGIMIKGNSNVVLEENTIEHNMNGIATDTSAQAGMVVVGNNISFNKENGIYLPSSTSNVSFSSNTILSNMKYGIYMIAYLISNVNFSSNTVLSNGLDGIWLDAYSDWMSAWSAPSISNVSISSNTVSFNGQDGMNFRGFTDWGMSSISNVSFLSNTVLSNAQNGIELQVHGYGGYSLSNVSFSENAVSCNRQNGIYLHGDGGWLFSPISDVRLSINTISSNTGNGISVVGGSPSTTFDIIATSNKLAGNKGDGLYISGGAKSNITENSICYNLYGVVYGTVGNLASQNDVYSNSYGMNVTGGATVNAAYNYWGDSSGPHNPSLNPEGQGNPVNGNGVNLTFIPFLASPQGRINQRPNAVLLLDKSTASPNEKVTFDATASTDDGRIDYYFYNFGDGSNSSWTSLPTVTHAYAATGTYNASLIVMDDFGVTSVNNTQSFILVSNSVPEFPSSTLFLVITITTLLGVVLLKKK